MRLESSRSASNSAESSPLRNAGRWIPLGLALLGVTFPRSPMAAAEAVEETASLTIHADREGPKVSPLLYGIFFEDINCSADGGIYAEMVRNRSFEDSDEPEHWSVASSGLARVELAVDRARPISPKNPRSLKVTVCEPGSGRVGIVNEGFWGMSVRKGEEYRLSFRARAGAGMEGPLTITLESRDGLIYGKRTIGGLTTDWRTFECALTSTETDPKARLVIATSAKGTFWLDMDPSRRRLPDVRIRRLPRHVQEPGRHRGFYPDPRNGGRPCRATHEDPAGKRLARPTAQYLGSAVQSEFERLADLASVECGFTRPPRPGTFGSLTRTGQNEGQRSESPPASVGLHLPCAEDCEAYAVGTGWNHAAFGEFAIRPARSDPGPRGRLGFRWCRLTVA
jgi:hypothetical protein